MGPEEGCRGKGGWVSGEGFRSGGGGKRRGGGLGPLGRGLGASSGVLLSGEGRGGFRGGSRRRSILPQHFSLLTIFFVRSSENEFLGSVLAERIFYAAPIGAFFCPETRAFTGFRGESSSTASKVLSDRKVLLKHTKWPLIAVNGR